MLNLLSLGLQFEMRSLIRNRIGPMAVVAYLSIGALAMFLGDRYVADWQQAINNAEDAQQQSIDDARGYFKTGQGPADRPWVDLSKPMWQDYYAGTRVHREPNALAGIAAGSVDSAPVAFQVNRRSDPSSGGGYRIENPELAMGSVDLTFVLAILSPLLIGLLGMGIGSREREERIGRLIVVQTGEVRGWFLARLIVITAMVAACNAVLCGAAALWGGASLFETVVILGLGVSYAALWGGLMAVVSAFAQTVRAQSLIYGVVWMGLCIVAPTVAAEVSLARVQTDFGVSETLEARALNYAAYELAIEDITTQIYAQYPELADLPAAADEKLDPGPRRHATSAVLVAAMTDRVDARQAEAQEAQQFTEQAAWTSPAVALTLAFERLAGVGPEAASAFQAYSMDAVNQRVRWILQQAWNKKPLDESDFESLVSNTPSAFRSEPQASGVSGLSMISWFVGSWLLAVIGFRREERHSEG